MISTCSSVGGWWWGALVVVVVDITVPGDLHLKCRRVHKTSDRENERDDREEQE
jgi:hypothetical protein